MSVMTGSNDSRQSVDTESASIPKIHVVSPRRPRRQPRDTGFPEPFDEGRTTTLPHPDADLSPNATISHDDVAADVALKRHRLSFLNKRKKTVNHGKISPHMEALHSVLSLSLKDTDSSRKESSAKLSSPSVSSLPASKEHKDGGDSLRSSRRGADDDADFDDETPPTSPDASEHPHKKGLFGKLRLKG